MQENVGGMDRKVRSVMGPVLMGLGLFRRGPVGMLSLLGGAALTGTAVTRKCLMNKMLGRDTHDRDRDRMRVSGANDSEMSENAEFDAGAAMRPPADS